MANAAIPVELGIAVGMVLGQPSEASEVVSTQPKSMEWSLAPLGSVTTSAMAVPTTVGTPSESMPWRGLAAASSAGPPGEAMARSTRVGLGS